MAIKPYDRDTFLAALQGSKMAQIQTAIAAGKTLYNMKGKTIRRNTKTKYGKGTYTKTNRSGTNAPTNSGNRNAMLYALSTPQKVQELVVSKIEWPAINNLTSDKTRLSNEVFCPGFKICQTFYNDALYPIEIHWAVLRFKNKEYATLDTALPEVRADFFRDPINTLDREADFPTSTAAYDQRLKCYPINPNRFDIMTHQKFMMGGKLSTISVNDSKHVMKIERWFRINKKLEFETPTAVNPNFPFILVSWACNVDPNDYSNVATPWRWETYITPYFKSK